MLFEEDSLKTETVNQAVDLFRSDVSRLSSDGADDWPIQALWSAINHIRASSDPYDLREAGELNKLIHRIKRGTMSHDMDHRMVACVVRLYLPEILTLLPQEYSSILRSAVAPHLPNIEPSFPE